jgi:sodium/potassium-transporting ATPase subunit alpha
MARLTRDGPNAITPPKKTSPFLLFFKELIGLFNLMLLVSAVLSLILFAIDSSKAMVNVYSLTPTE